MELLIPVEGVVAAVGVEVEVAEAAVEEVADIEDDDESDDDTWTVKRMKSVAAAVVGVEVDAVVEEAEQETESE